MSLSQRFDRILKDQPREPAIIRQVHNTYQNGVSSVSLQSDRIGRAQQFVKPSKFLHDDYMDNELYGAPIGKSRSRLLNGSYNDDYKYDDEDYQNIDPVSMTLDDYITRRPRRRGFGIGKFFGNRNRGSGTGRFIPAKKRFGYLDFDNFVPFLFDDQKRQRRNRGQNAPLYVPDLPPIQNRLSLIPTKRPFRNFNRFSRPMSRGIRKSRPRFPPRYGRPRFGFRKNRRSDDPRSRMTLEDLDREIESYMKASKHPRIGVVA